MAAGPAADILVGAMGVLGFPNPVNEKAARVVAGVVAVLATAAIALGLEWMIPVLAYGFVARVLTGPRLSPLGRLASRVVAPRLGAERPVPGPPKRFAQGIGAVLTLAATGLWLAGATTAAWLLVGAVAVAAMLEAALGFCLGCRIFTLLMRAGLVPERVCLECADVSGRLAR